VSQVIPLSTLNVGQFGRVISFTDELTSLKLIEMGIYPGEVIQLERLAPLGCPMLINLPSSQISLRMEEAESVLLESVEHA